MATKTKKLTVAETPAPEAVAEAAEAMFAGYESLADVGRENVTAILRTNAVLTEGFEAIGKEVLLYARATFEKAAETASALLSARTFEDVYQLNTAFAKTHLEQLVARSAKLSEMGMKVTNEAFAPLGGRVEATLHKLGKPIAA